MNQEEKSSSKDATSFSIPWKKVFHLNLLFSYHYLLRSVSWEIWRASRSTTAYFDELKFGETPVRTVQRILRELPSVGRESVVADLGCGRGRAAFYFHLLSDAKVVGYDVVSSYIGTARVMAQKTDCSEAVLFYAEDFRSLRLEEFDVIYVCALCFGAETRQILLERFLEATSGVHIVTAGWQPQHDRLESVAHFRAAFSWGHTSVSIARLA